MFNRLLLVISLCVLALAAVLAFGGRFATACPSFHDATLTIQSRPWNIGIARTVAQQEKGLAGCRHLPAMAGLYFPFSPASSVVFWMKDMVIPIDIIWIANGAVVGIESNVPAPAPEQRTLPRYAPPQPVDAVLEIGAGEAAKQGIAVGTAVKPF